MTLKEIREASHKNAIAIMVGQIHDFRLEQVEKDKGDWDVVVSFLVANMNQSEGPTGLLGISQTNQNKPYERVYKRMIIDDQGSLKKMLMYKD